MPMFKYPKQLEKIHEQFEEALTEVEEKDNLIIWNGV